MGIYWKAEERDSDFSDEANLGKSKGTELMGFPFQLCCFVSSSSSSKFILCFAYLREIVSLLFV